MIRLRWLLIKQAVKTSLWMRPALFAFWAILVVILAGFADRFIPWPFPFSVDADVIRTLLTIMATSMLTVTTFSVSVMLSAYVATISASSPRAFKIVLAESSTKQVLSSFIGAFIFSVIGIVALELGYFEAVGRAVLFAITLWLFVWVVGTLVYWIDHVARLSTLNSTIEKVAARATKALADHMHAPAMGGTTDSDAPLLDSGGKLIAADRLGRVQFIDVKALSNIAENLDCSIRLQIAIGELITIGAPLARLNIAEIEEKFIKEIRQAIIVDGAVEVEQDPSRGLRILSEIASRALSPGINDPGTAMDVLDAIAGVFMRANSRANENEPADCDPRIITKVVPPEAIFSAAFAQTGRDGAAMVEVAAHLQDVMRALEPVVPNNWRAALYSEAENALERAQAALTNRQDLARLNKAAGKATKVTI